MFLYLPVYLCTFYTVFFSFKVRIREAPEALWHTCPMYSAVREAAGSVRRACRKAPLIAISEDL